MPIKKRKMKTPTTTTIQPDSEIKQTTSKTRVAKDDASPLRIAKEWISIVVKCSVVVAQIAFNNPIFLGFVGVLNRLSGGRLITSVFLAYPANKKILHRHTFPIFCKIYRQKPSLLGFFLVDGRLTHSSACKLRLFRAE